MIQHTHNVYITISKQFCNITVLFQTFLQWFCAYQFDSLFPSASFTRRTTALSNLMLIKDIFGFKEDDGTFRQLLSIKMISYSLTGHMQAMKY